VFEVDPRLVTLDASSTPSNVKYANFTAILARALQEVWAYITSRFDKQDIRIDTLEERIRELEAREGLASPPAGSEEESSSAGIEGADVDTSAAPDESPVEESDPVAEAEPPTEIEEAEESSEPETTPASEPEAEPESEEIAEPSSEPVSDSSGAISTNPYVVVH